MATTYQTLQLRFAMDDGSSWTSRTTDALIETMKAGYVSRDDLPVERFEETVDAILRYGHRIEWWAHAAYLDLRGNELGRYPALAEML